MVEWVFNMISSISEASTLKGSSQINAAFLLISNSCEFGKFELNRRCNICEAQSVVVFGNSSDKCIYVFYFKADCGNCLHNHLIQSSKPFHIACLSCYTCLSRTEKYPII